MTKTLLVLGAGIQSVDGLRQLADQGWHIVGCDGDAGAPGFAVCNDHIVASVYHAEQCVPAARDYHDKVRPIDGVMCLAVDTPHVVARVAQELDLPGLPVDVADLAVDKIAMKTKFTNGGVPTPRFQEIASPDDLENFWDDNNGSVVVKPVDSRGSKGVSWIRDRDDLAHAFEYAHHWSPGNRVMVEVFVDGPQLSTESVVVDGTAHTIGVSDRNYEFLETYAPRIVENGGDVPSALSDPLVESAHGVVQQVADVFGIRNGIIKGDIVIRGDHAQVIEVALRLSGGFFCTHQIPLSTGISTIIPTAKLALGLPVEPAELMPKFRHHVIQRYIFPSPGTVKSVSGVEMVSSMPSVAYADVWARPGDKITHPENSGGSAGIVMTAAENRDAAFAAMTKALNDIQIVTGESDG